MYLRTSSNKFGNILILLAHKRLSINKKEVGSIISNELKKIAEIKLPVFKHQKFRWCV